MGANKKHLSWDIHYACGYVCSYCFLRARGPDAAVRESLRGPGEWLDAWDRFYERFGPARIDIAGGEPFLYPEFTRILGHLSQKHEIYVISNFASDLSALADTVPPEKVRLVLSMHPEHVSSADGFLEKAAALRRRGFRVRITAVAYPPFIETVLDYGRRCEAYGLKFTGTPFFGSYMGRQYPLAYTEKEKASLSGMFDQPRHALYQLQRINPAGRRCNAGVNYCRLSPDGTARPCLNGPVMGNFLDPDFVFLKTPLVCPSPHCHCRLEFEYCQGEVNGPAAQA